jgi:hypothetical protein
MMSPIVQATKDGTVLSIRVQPNASRTECAGLHGEALKIRVAAPPVDGAANEAVTGFLAEELGVPRASVSVQSGAGARSKRVLVKGLSPDQVRARLRPLSRRGAAEPR